MTSSKTSRLRTLVLFTFVYVYCSVLMHGCAAGPTHHAVDAVLAQRSFRNDHQVGLDAPFLQVVAAVASVSRLHVKLAVETLDCAL